MIYWPKLQILKRLEPSQFQKSSDTDRKWPNTDKIFCRHVFFLLKATVIISWNNKLCYYMGYKYWINLNRVAKTSPVAPSVTKLVSEVGCSWRERRVRSIDCEKGCYKHLQTSCKNNLSRLMTKPTKWLCAQRRLRSDWAPVWSESSLSAWRKLWSLATHWAHSEDSDQTERMPRLIWVVAGRTFILLFLSWGGSPDGW